MSRLGEGLKIVGRMTALSADGRPVVIAWACFVEEDVDSASAYEVLRGGRLVPLDDVGPWREWKKVAALTGPEGG